jgi:Secretion system C-terminal sorting domain
MKHFNSIQLNGSRLTAHGSRLTAHGSRLTWLSSILAAVLLFCFAYSSSSRAQSVPQKSPTSVFHVFQAGSPVLQGAKSRDTLLDGPVNPLFCCNVIATLNQIAPCGDSGCDTCYHTRKNGISPLEDVPPPCISSCCVDLEIIWYQPTQCEYPICGCDVNFDDGDGFDPLCNVCSMPPGWTEYIDNPYQNVIHFRYTGTHCSSVPSSMDFQFCGQNSSGVICGNVTVYTCTTDPTSGLCEIGASMCSPGFCNTLDCSMADVVGTNPSAFTVDAGYPNPATSSIRFGFSSASQGKMTMTLVDILGHTISATNNIVSQGDGSAVVDLGTLQPGAYYCVFDLNGTTLTRRVLVK